MEERWSYTLPWAPWRMDRIKCDTQIHERLMIPVQTNYGLVRHHHLLNCNCFAIPANTKSRHAQAHRLPDRGSHTQAAPMVLNNAQLVATKPVTGLSRESIREQPQLLREYRLQLHFHVAGHPGGRHLTGKTTLPGIPAGAGTAGRFPTAIGYQGRSLLKAIGCLGCLGAMAELCLCFLQGRGGFPCPFHWPIKPQLPLDRWG